MTDTTPDKVRALLDEYGLAPRPEDGRALQRSVEEILAARACLRPLSPDDEPAPVFRPL